MDKYEVKGIVAVESIPKVGEIVDVPMDNPLEVYRICCEMEVLCDANKGIGLSATQVGIPWKLFIVKTDDYSYYVNCDYEPVTEERIVSLEGCLSVRSEEGQLRSFQVERHKRVKICGYRLKNNNDNNKVDFEKFDDKLESAEGVVFQHEIDHQKAVLISDFGKEIFIWQ